MTYTKTGIKTGAKFVRALTALPLLTAVACLAACSGGSASPGVAAAGTPTASASATSTLSSYQKSLAFAKCIRAHGVPNFPDPQQSGGSLTLGSGSGFDPSSPAFQAALTACESLSPGASASRAAFDPAKIAGWTACLRDHGLPKLPDPQNMGNGVAIDLNGTPYSQATAQAAMTACESESPGGEIGTISGGSQ
jgi:hypothetical protein